MTSWDIEVKIEPIVAEPSMNNNQEGEDTNFNADGLITHMFFGVVKYGKVRFIDWGIFSDGETKSEDFEFKAFDISKKNDDGEMTQQKLLSEVVIDSPKYRRNRIRVSGGKDHLSRGDTFSVKCTYKLKKSFNTEKDYFSHTATHFEKNITLKIILPYTDPDLHVIPSHLCMGGVEVDYPKEKEPMVDTQVEANKTIISWKIDALLLHKYKVEWISSKWEKKKKN